MQAQLDKAQTGLQGLTAENSVIQQQIDQTLQQIDLARQQVETVYAAVGTAEE